jgi:deoxyribodipyrimidine photolyase
MNDKKNIERLFQERFKDFEVAPPENAWQNIAARLEKKESKKRMFNRTK